jgi:hypothetical protein
MTTKDCGRFCYENFEWISVRVSIGWDTIDYTVLHGVTRYNGMLSDTIYCLCTPRTTIDRQTSTKNRSCHS